MQISAISSAQTPAAATAATTSATTTPASGKTLTQDDFLKLLATQFQNQDPMKPMDDTAYIAQMASFTSLEQAKTTTAEMVKMSANQSLATANSYLGKQVTVDNGDGTVTTDVVSAITVDATNGPRIVVGNTPYAVTAVTYVEPAPVSTSPAKTPVAAGGS